MIFTPNSIKLTKKMLEVFDPLIGQNHAAHPPLLISSNSVNFMSLDPKFKPSN